MAIVGTNLETTVAVASATSRSTGSLIPVSGDVVLAFINVRNSNGVTVVPTATGTNGFSVTWTQVAGVTYDAAPHRIDVFRGVPSSTTAGVITFDYGAESEQQWAWSVIQVSGVDQATNQGVVQSATGTATDTTPTVTLAAFGNGSNAAALGAGFHGIGSRVWTPKAGYTGYSAIDTTSSHANIGSEWIGSSDTTPNATIVSMPWGAIGIELKATVAAAIPPLILVQSVMIAVPLQIR